MGRAMSGEMPASAEPLYRIYGGRQRKMELEALKMGCGQKVRVAVRHLRCCQQRVIAKVRGPTF